MNEENKITILDFHRDGETDIMVFKGHTCEGLIDKVHDWLKEVDPFVDQYDEEMWGIKHINTLIRWYNENSCNGLSFDYQFSNLSE